MKRFLMVVGLGASLIAYNGGVAAQEPNGGVINADGTSGTSSAGLNPTVDADGPTIVYGDLNPGPGTTEISAPAAPAPAASSPGTSGNITANDGNASTLGPGSASAAPGTVNGESSGTSLLGPDGTYSVSDAPPSNVTVGDSGAAAPAPEAAPEAAPVDDTAAAAPADTAPVNDADLDGDNYPDAQELEIGLDPTNIDTDGDGVADGDELNIYGTDPFTWDSDGDGLSDGTELYDTHTDPLVWEDHSGGETDTAAATSAEPVAEDTSATEATAGDSDSDRLSDADEAAIGTDPNNPDSDGDGYYDGDEANLGTDPFDPGSFPAQ
jgi:hypothetical protein